VIILGLETATKVCGVALADDDRVLVELSTSGRLTHSQRLLPMVEQALRESGLDRCQLDGIAVSAGPGSFTGLRIGMATAKGLGYALDRPVLAVPTLDALALNGWAWSGLVCPLLDARRNQVYAAVYRGADGGRDPRRLGGYWALELAALLDHLCAFDEPILFLGDAGARFGPEIRARLGGKASFAPLSSAFPRAAGVAEIGLRLLAAGHRPTAAEARPVYVRPSEAEIRAGRPAGRAITDGSR